MPQYTSSEMVVQNQLDAYNAKDVDAWLSTYAPNAKQFELGSPLLADGHAQNSGGCTGPLKETSPSRPTDSA